MSRTARTWLLFIGGLVFVLGGLAIVSVTVLTLHEARRLEREQAALEENVRLALWRMDTALAPLFARENARSPAAYDLSPSAPVKRYFQVDGRGLNKVSGEQTDKATELAKKALPSMPWINDEDDLDARDDAMLAALETKNDAGPVGNVAQQVQRQANFRQVKKTSTEFQRRSRYVAESITQNVFSRDQKVALAPVLSDTRQPITVIDGDEGILAPAWVEGELLLLRRVRMGGKLTTQGLWIDWAVLKKTLLSEVADLLPSANLAAVGGERTWPGRMLASLPVRLVPGAIASRDLPTTTPIWPVLVVAWLGVLLGAVAVAVLLMGVLALSERRAAFVSSVTHELRTPLTTFQMYTEMLSEGMVDEDKRGRYLDTLRREATRLAHLVENVLSYSQVEQGRRAPSRVPFDVDDLLERNRLRLAERAEQAGLSLVFEQADEAKGLRALGDCGNVEQVLFNLVDNASKYAAKATDNRLILRIEADPRRVRWTLRDHGPGLDPQARRTLFQPFSKSAARAALSAPGVGLGLALCRRLARAMGGDLLHVTPRTGGAAFTLVLQRK